MSQPLRAALAGAASRQRRAVAGSWGLHPSGVPGIPGRAAGSGPVCTALRREGRAVARAKSPRHRRLRLRHEIHRRGNASAASRPSQARARVAETVCQSAQPPADWSVQRLRQRRRWTAPAHSWAARRCSGPPVGAATRSNRRCALPPRSAPQGAHTEGTGAAALCPCRWFLSPPSPSRGRCGSHPLLHGGGCAAPTTGPSLSVLPPCKRLECNAAGLLRQGPASQRAPAGRPPRSDRQQRCIACQAGRGAGGPRSLALCVPGDRRRTRMPDAAQAWAGGQRGGSVPPHPSPVAALRCRSNGL